MSHKAEEMPDLFAIVDEFVTASLDGAVADRQLAEFDLLLRNSEEAQRLYLDCVELSVRLPRVLAQFGFGDDR